MRIAITNPTTWRYLHRGVERWMGEVAPFLAQRGHDVTIISGKPGRTETLEQDGYRTIYCRRLWHPVLGRLGFWEFHAFFFPALFRLLRNRYDVVICCTFMDGFAAEIARWFTRTPYVFVSFALPPRVQHFRSLSLKGAVFERVSRKADAFVAISKYVRQYFEERWKLQPQVLMLPVDLCRGRPASSGRDTPPAILFASVAEDPRKGLPALVRAFDLLKASGSDSVLKIAWNVTDQHREQLLGLLMGPWKEDIHFLGGDVNLPELLGRASVTVLPSLWEAQGLIILESLASGTPVVGTRDGALPELITDSRIGRLFDPGSDNVYEPTNIVGLAQALRETLELSRLPETVQNCRKHAEAFSWEVLGPQWERLLEQTAGRTEAQAAPLERIG